MNVHHNTIRLAELAGNKIEMSRRPLVSGGKRVASRSGGEAVVFDPSAESRALSRWQDGHFLDVERQFAKDRRSALSDIDLDGIFRQGRDIIKRTGRPKDLAAAKLRATELLGKHAPRYAFGAKAVALPIPEAPPVITTTLPVITSTL